MKVGIKSLHNIGIRPSRFAYSPYANLEGSITVTPKPLKLKPSRLGYHKHKITASLNNVNPSGMQPPYYFLYILFKVNGDFIMLNSVDIYFIEAADNYIKIFYTPDKFYLAHTTLKKLEEVLHPDFFCRVHRSYIINITRINLVKTDTILMGNLEIPTHKQYLEALFQRIKTIR